MVESRLTLIGPTNKRANDRHILYLYKCSCGNTITVPKKAVSSGNTKSCGCLRKEISAMTVTHVQHLAAKVAKVSNRTHGMRNTRFYKIWQGMHWRCKDPKNANYGGRGIQVDERWHKFQNFMDDMYSSYQEHIKTHEENRKFTTIERINVNGNYELGNCTWATMKQQAANTRRSNKAN